MERLVAEPSDLGAHAFPVSVKGVAVRDGKVLLLENERNEWELPGGKLEPGEEAGWLVTAGRVARPRGGRAGP